VDGPCKVCIDAPSNEHCGHCSCCTGGKPWYTWQFFYRPQPVILGPLVNTAEPNFMGEWDLDAAGSLSHPTEAVAMFCRQYRIHVLDLDECSYLELEDLLEAEVRKHDPTFFSFEPRNRVAGYSTKVPPPWSETYGPPGTVRIVAPERLFTDEERERVIVMLITDVKSNAFGDGQDEEHIRGGWNLVGLDQMSDAELLQESGMYGIIEEGMDLKQAAAALLAVVGKGLAPVYPAGPDDAEVDAHDLATVEPCSPDCPSCKGIPCSFCDGFCHATH
jgi:hypothetical protein